MVLLPKRRGATALRGRLLLCAVPTLVRASSEMRVQSFSTLMVGQKKRFFDLWKYRIPTLPK